MRKISKPHSKKSSPQNLGEAKRILAVLKQLNLQQEKISADTGIHQSQISRLLRGDFKKLNGNALKLCNYANNMTTDTQTRHGEFREEIIRHALSLWDGNNESGKNVIEFLQALKRLQLGKRNKSQ